MFSPNLPPIDVPKARSRMRRILPQETTQQAREDSVAPSVGRQAREDNAPPRTRKAFRKEEDAPKEKDKQEEGVVWVCRAVYGQMVGDSC